MASQSHATFTCASGRKHCLQELHLFIIQLPVVVRCKLLARPLALHMSMWLLTISTDKSRVHGPI
ncbi:MAG: hypothetical protein ACK55I_30945, partial [bacterium]